MGRLLYSVASSLDGYLADEQGRYDWAVPSEEAIAFVNEMSAGVTTYLYGRRMYEEMRVWETDPTAAEQSPESAAFARLWQATRKVVFSTTLEEVTTQRTELHHRFDPDLVRRLKDEATGDLFVEGPTLAAHALRAGLVDEVSVLLAPVTVGGGLRVHPPGLRLDLDLVEQRRFDDGMAFLRYRVRT